jgi:biopolymer transport protein ExbD
MLRGKRERRADPYYCAIDVTGFAAIMVVLLAIMMTPHMSITQVRHLVVDLPKVSHASTQWRAMREDAITITVSLDGKLFFRSDRVSFERLSSLIRDGLQGGAEHKVYVYADARAQYGVVQEALQKIREAGIENIAFITTDKHPSVVGP